MQELVSVIVPAYNCAATILESLHSALAQTYVNLEVLVIDDASQDTTAALVRELAAREPRVRLISQKENSGAAEARNRGMDEAAGAFLAFLDADDLWEPEKLARQLEYMATHEVDVLATAYRFIDKEGRLGRVYHIPSGRIGYRELLCENSVGCSTVLARAKLMRGYRFEKEYAHEDYRLWLELTRSGLILYGLDEVLVRYRVGGRSADKLAAAKERWRIYREAECLPLLKSAGFFAEYAARGAYKHLWAEKGEHQANLPRIPARQAAPAEAVQQASAEVARQTPTEAAQQAPTEAAQQAPAAAKEPARKRKKTPKKKKRNTAPQKEKKA